MNPLLIALSYITLIILVNPIGDFPLNDDWAYARSVLSLVEDGEFVEKDQDIVEIDSDKATMPLAAPTDGKIKIVVAEGETIEINTTITLAYTYEIIHLFGKYELNTMKGTNLGEFEELVLLVIGIMNGDAYP